MRTIVVTAPEPVVEWDVLDQHLRLEGDETERDLIEAMLAAATQHIDGPDGWLGRAIGEQVLETYLPSFGTGRSIPLPFPPAVEIVSISYVDGSGAIATMVEADYELRGQVLQPVFGRSWPTANWQGIDGETVRIRYRAGYAAIPAPIRAAILLMVGDLFNQRESFVTGISATEVPMSVTVERLLGPYRRWM